MGRGGCNKAVKAEDVLGAIARERGSGGSIASIRGMVHAWVGKKLVIRNIVSSFIQCHEVAIVSLFYISDTLCVSIFLNN